MSLAAKMLCQDSVFAETDAAVVAEKGPIKFVLSFKQKKNWAAQNRILLIAGSVMFWFNFLAEIQCQLESLENDNATWTIFKKIHIT